MKNDSVITDRGQLTLPKRLRDRFGLRSGTRIQFATTKHGILIQKIQAPTTTRKAFGILDDQIATDDYLTDVRGSVK